MRGCVTATGTGMGTSVCLHLDELVSEQPLESAWRSPMTPPLLHLQDETPSQRQPVPTAPLALVPGGDAVAGCSLPLPGPPAPIYPATLRRPLTQEKTAGRPITSLEEAFTAFLWRINISWALSSPQESGLRSYSGIWAPGQGPPTDSPATGMPPSRTVFPRPPPVGTLSVSPWAAGSYHLLHRQPALPLSPRGSPLPPRPLSLFPLRAAPSPVLKQAVFCSDHTAFPLVARSVLPASAAHTALLLHPGLVACSSSLLWGCLSTLLPRPQNPSSGFLGPGGIGPSPLRWPPQGPMIALCPKLSFGSTCQPANLGRRKGGVWQPS